MGGFHSTERRHERQEQPSAPTPARSLLAPPNPLPRTPPHLRTQQIVIVPPTAPAQQPIVRRPQMRIQQTRVVRNPVNVLKNSVVCSEKGPNLSFSFVFDASTAAEISILYLIREIGDQSNLIPFQVCPVRPRRFEAGLKQTFLTGESDSLRITTYDDWVQWRTRENIKDGYDFVIELRSVTLNSSANLDSDMTTMQRTYGNIIKESKNPTSALTDGALHTSNDSSTDAFNWRVQVCRQKIDFGHSSYEVQDIYGIERRGSLENRGKSHDTLRDEVGTSATQSEGREAEFLSGRECVICLEEERNTLLLPCRHMCLCTDCAQIMRMESNKCPICRQTVYSLLLVSASQEPRQCR